MLNGIFCSLCFQTEELIVEYISVVDHTIIASEYKAIFAEKEMHITCD